MLNKFKRYLNRVLLFCPKTKQVQDFKEELLGILMDRYNECIAEGKSQDESYKECIESIGDYRETIAEMEKELEKQKNTNKQSIVFTIITLVYVVAVTLGYILYSVLADAWNISWLIFIGALIVYGIVYFSLWYKRTKYTSRYFFARINITIVIALVATILYLLVSFLTGIWDRSWIMYLGAALFAFSVDVWYRVKFIKKKINDIDLAIFIALVTLIVFFSVSFALDAWYISWISFIIAIMIYLMAILVRRIVVYNKERNRIVHEEIEKKND